MARLAGSSPMADECELDDLQELLELERCDSSANDTSDQSGAEQKASAAGKSAKTKPSYKHIPHSQKPAHLVAKRNARERRRVQAVNQAFYTLRRCVPIENRNKRVSKVKTLQRAIDYIRRLERILASDDDGQLELPSADQLQAQQRSTGRRARKAANASAAPRTEPTSTNSNHCDPAAAEQPSAGRARRPRQKQQLQPPAQQQQQQQQVAEPVSSADCQLARAGYAQACEQQPQPLYSCPMDTCGAYDTSSAFPAAYYGGADVAPAGQLHYLAPANNCYEPAAPHQQPQPQPQPLQHQSHHQHQHQHQHQSQHQNQNQNQHHHQQAHPLAHHHQPGYLSLTDGYQQQPQAQVQQQPAGAFYTTSGCVGVKLEGAYAAQQSVESSSAVYARPGEPSERLPAGWSGSLQSPSSSTVSSSSSSGGSCAGGAGQPLGQQVGATGYLGYPAPPSGPFGERQGHFAHLAPAKARNLPLGNLAAGEQFNNQQTGGQMLGRAQSQQPPSRALYQQLQHQQSQQQQQQRQSSCSPAAPASPSSPALPFLGRRAGAMGSNHHHLHTAELAHLSAGRSANSLVPAQALHEYAAATQL